MGRGGTLTLSPPESFCLVLTFCLFRLDVVSDFCRIDRPVASGRYGSEHIDESSTLVIFFRVPYFRVHCILVVSVILSEAAVIYLVRFCFLRFCFLLFIDSGEDFSPERVRVISIARL